MVVNLYRKLVFDDFTSVDGWSGSGNCITSGYGASRNTTSTYIKTGKSSMKVAFDYDASTEGSLTKTYSVTHDFSLYDEVWINFYIDDLNDLSSTTDQAFRMRIGNDSSNYLFFKRDKTELKTGWNLIKMDLDAMDSVTGSVDLKTVDYLMFTSYDSGVSDYNIYIDSLWLMKKIILQNTFGPVKKGITGRTAIQSIPNRNTPVVQVIGKDSPTWSIDFTLLESYDGSTVLYGSEYDRVLQSSLLEDCLLKPCVLEPDLTSKTIEFRDDDGASNADANIDATTDYFRKWIYVPSVSNLKTATLYVYVKEHASNPPEDADTLDVKVNGVWHVGVWNGTNTTGTYAWLTLSLSPEHLVEGYNEIQIRGVGVSASDIFCLGTDTGSDYARSQYSTDSGSTWTDTTGEYMIYLACTFEHHTQYALVPMHIIPTNIELNYEKGKLSVLPYHMEFIEDLA